MGKRKISIEKIDDKKRMNVTFSKRRKGLFSKALNISGLCNAKIAMVVFSPAGKPYTFVTHTSSVDTIIDQYLKNISFKEQLNQCSLEELQLLRSSLESLRGQVCQKLDDAHAEQLLVVEDESRVVTACDFVTDRSSCPLYPADGRRGVADSDFVTDLSSFPLSSTGEDASTVFATAGDENYADWIVADDREDFFNHIFYDNSDGATTSDFLSDKATYPMSGVDEDDWTAANDNEDFFDHLFDDNSAGTPTSDFIIDKATCLVSGADENDWMIADDNEDLFDHLFDDISAATTFDFIGDNATYPMSGADEDVIKGLPTNDDKSYSNETVLDNSSKFFEQILSFWS